MSSSFLNSRSLSRKKKKKQKKQWAAILSTVSYSFLFQFVPFSSWSPPRRHRRNKLPICLGPADQPGVKSTLNLGPHSVPTVFRLYSDSVPTVFRLSSYSVPTLFRLCSTYIPTQFRLCSDSASTVFRLSSDSVPTMFRLCSLVVVSHRPSSDVYRCGSSFLAIYPALLRVISRIVHRVNVYIRPPRLHRPHPPSAPLPPRRHRPLHCWPPSALADNVQR